MRHRPGALRLRLAALPAGCGGRGRRSSTSPGAHPPGLLLAFELRRAVGSVRRGRGRRGRARRRGVRRCGRAVTGFEPARTAASSRLASRPNEEEATTARTVANSAVTASTLMAVRASPPSSTISRASSKAAIAPISSDASVIASTRWRSVCVRLVTRRSTTPPTTAAPSTRRRRPGLVRVGRRWRPSRSRPRAGSWFEPVSDAPRGDDPARVSGSGSSFWRSRPTWTVTVAGSW